MTDYEAKLKTPEWMEFREHVLDVKGHECENCHRLTERPHIHHSGYVRGREPWDYEVSEVSVVCRECHDVIHRRRKEFEALFDSLEPATLAVLLDGLAKFRELGIARHRHFAELTFCFLRQQMYSDASPLIDYAELSVRRRDIQNFLLSLSESTLDPLLDGFDVFRTFSPKQQHEVARQLRPYLTDHEIRADKEGYGIAAQCHDTDT